MRVQFVAKENGPERLVCDAEIVFGEDAGPLSGMKLVGFSLWRTADGDVYVIGGAVSGVPMTAGGFQPDSQGASDAYVLRLDASLTSAVRG